MENRVYYIYLFFACTRLAKTKNTQFYFYANSKRIWWTIDQIKAEITCVTHHQMNDNVHNIFENEGNQVKICHLIWSFWYSALTSKQVKTAKQTFFRQTKALTQRRSKTHFFHFFLLLWQIFINFSILCLYVLNGPSGIAFFLFVFMCELFF